MRSPDRLENEGRPVDAGVLNVVGEDSLCEINETSLRVQ